MSLPNRREQERYCTNINDYWLKNNGRVANARLVETKIIGRSYYTIKSDVKPWWQPKPQDKPPMKF